MAREHRGVGETPRNTARPGKEGATPYPSPGGGRTPPALRGGVSQGMRGGAGHPRGRILPPLRPAPAAPRQGGAGGRVPPAGSGAGGTYPVPPPYREAPNPGGDRGYPAGRHVGRAAPGPAVKSRRRLRRRHFPAGLSQGRTHGRQRWREGRDPGKAAPVCYGSWLFWVFSPPSPVNFFLFLLLLLFLFSWDIPGWSERSFMPTRAMPGSALGPLPCKYLCGRSGPGGGPGRDALAVLHGFLRTERPA